VIKLGGIGENCKGKRITVYNFQSGIWIEELGTRIEDLGSEKPQALCPTHYALPTGIYLI